jgi:Tol biopolymer transport system component
MYEHDTPQTSTVRLVRPDGSGAHDIPLPCSDPCSGISGGPSWLTNHRIAYVVVVNGPIDAAGNAASVAVFTARPDGSDARRFSRRDEARFGYSNLRLSPDQRICSSSSRSAAATPTKTFVDIAAVPTTCGSLAECASKIVWLTDNAATGRRNANPQWSPDDSSLVFTDRPSIDVNDAEIWTMRYLGTQRRKISNSPDFDFRPTWGVRNGGRG